MSGRVPPSLQERMSNPRGQTECDVCGAQWLVQQGVGRECRGWQPGPLMQVGPRKRPFLPCEGVQKGQTQRPLAGTLLPSRDGRGLGPPLHCDDRDRVTNLCFIRVWRNHLCTWKAKKNLDVPVVHKFEEGTLKAKLRDKAFEVT